MTIFPATEPTLGQRGRPLSIVVADDVEEMRDLIAGWLEALGHQVFKASTGAEVSRLLRGRDFDLIITDVLMPDGDGLDVIAAAHKMKARPPVLAISGGGKYMVASDCLRIAKGVGADEVLLKPFKRGQLLDAVGRITRL